MTFSPKLMPAVMRDFPVNLHLGGPGIEQIVGCSRSGQQAQQRPWELEAENAKRKRLLRCHAE